MSTTVEARFAGGPIIVDAVDPWDTMPALVEVNLPGLSVGLFPHEARALAAALVEHATTAETRRSYAPAADER